MTAAEMFNNLDYKLNYESNTWIAYKHIVDPIYIVFSIQDKGYYAFELMPDNSKMFLGIQVEEHRAISKWLEEKGWL